MKCPPPLSLSRTHARSVVATTSERKSGGGEGERSRELSHSLRGGELGHRLGALGHGVLGELAGEDQAHGGLDLPGGDRRLLVVAGQLGGLGGDLLNKEVEWRKRVSCCCFSSHFEKKTMASQRRKKKSHCFERGAPRRSLSRSLFSSPLLSLPLFSSHLLEDVVDERVEDRHGLGRDAGVGVHLLQDLVDVDLVRLVLGLDALLGAALGDLLGGLLGGGFGGHGDGLEVWGLGGGGAV